MNKLMIVVALGFVGCESAHNCELRVRCELSCEETAEICSDSFDIDSCIESCQDSELTEESLRLGQACAQCYIEQTQCNPMYLQEFCSEECFTTVED